MTDDDDDVVGDDVSVTATHSQYIFSFGVSTTVVHGVFFCGSAFEVCFLYSVLFFVGVDE